MDTFYRGLRIVREWVPSTEVTKGHLRHRIERVNQPGVPVGWGDSVHGCRTLIDLRQLPKDYLTKV